MHNHILNPRVFWGSTIVAMLLLMTTLIAPGASNIIFSQVQDWIIEYFGWFYVASVAFFIIVVIILAFGPTGRLRLGPDDAEPDFPYLSWLAMLFAAGMGIGLMYFAVAEPIQHYSAPPEEEPGTILAAREAMVITFTHWGIHGWSIYALIGLSLAYFSYRKGLPLTLRSGLFPLLGKKINGWSGDAVDIFAICGTLFGIATSLGFGVSQMAAGLNHVYDIPNSTVVQASLIIIVMGIATLSVLSGVDRGVRRLSELNLILAVLLMLFVLITGPTLFLLRALVQNFGLYLDHFFVRTFTLYAYEPRAWMANWTLFYWAWWIAWSPFVGMFIARISRGRTVREFIIGVLLVPTAFTFLWMTIFGNTAIAFDLGIAKGAIAQAVNANLSTALFEFFEFLPGVTITSTLAILLVGVFFVTSADSGSLVIDTLASGGIEDTPRWQRIYWCLVIGATATLLMIAGGLGALQAATLMAALPFCFIMILLAYGLIRQTNADLEGIALETEGPPVGERLKRLFAPASHKDIIEQMNQHVKPALTSVRDALHPEEWVDCKVEQDGEALKLSVKSAVPDRQFIYRFSPQSRALPAYTALEASEKRRSLTWFLSARIGENSRSRDLTGFTTQQIMDDVLEQLGKWRAQ